MNPRQRARSLRETGRADRLPWQMFGACRCLVPGAEGLLELDLERRVELELRLYRRFGFDGVSLGPGMFGLAEAAGSRLGYRREGPAQLVQPLLDAALSLDRLEFDGVLQHGRLPAILQGLERLQGAVGNECPVSSNLAGPFTTAAGLWGPERLRRALVEAPQQVDALLERASALVLIYADALIARGITPALADPFASGSLLSPAQFARFALPALDTCLSAIAARSGARAVLHLCGRTEALWPLLRTLPLGGFSLGDSEDLAAAQRAFAGHCALIGNLAPVTLLARGSAREIEQAVTAAVSTAGHHPDGYCLAPGCSLRAATPLVHLNWTLQALQQASAHLWR